RPTLTLPRCAAMFAAVTEIDPDMLMGRASPVPASRLTGLVHGGLPQAAVTASPGCTPTTAVIAVTSTAAAPATRIFLLRDILFPSKGLPPRRDSGGPSGVGNGRSPPRARLGPPGRPPGRARPPVRGGR